MKKYFLLAAAAATVLAVSCNKEKEQPKVDPTPGTEIEDNTPQPIRFGTNVAVVKSPITKGLGAIDTWSTSQKLYIYGLKRDLDSQSPTTAYVWDDIKIDNIGATAPDGIGNTGRDNINVYDPDNTRYKVPEADDATAVLPSDPSYNQGTMTAKVPGYFYYDEGAYYDFFGYYVDDATGYTDAETPAVIDPNPTVAESKIVLSNLTIDGTQDIMLAENASAAAKLEDIMWRADQSKAVTTADLYSAKSARRDVVPNLHFEHQLSRFVFNVVKADNTVVSEVENLTIKSHNKATLTIAGEGRGIAFTNDDPVNLEGKKNDAFTFEVKPDANAPVPAEALYADIMVEPGNNKYPFSVYISQPGTKYTSTNPYEVELEVDFGTDPQSAPILAQAGKKYVVNVVVYGLEKILITVSLAEWDEVEFGWVDPDKANETPDTRKQATLTLQANVYENDVVGAVTGDATAASVANGGKVKISIAGASAEEVDLTPEQLTALAQTAYFKSSNINVAKVDKSTGVVTVVGAATETATITVTVNNASYYGTADFEITVSGELLDNSLAVANAGSITLDANGTGTSASDVITTSGEGALTITGASNGSEADYTAYFSINENKLSVQKDGDNTIAAGEYTITVNAAGDTTHKPATKQITVTIVAYTEP